MSNGNNGFIGTSGFFYEGESGSPLTMSVDGKTYSKAFWLFQWAFAGAAATIVSGAVAERCKFGAYMTYSCVITAFIYPISVHMAWSGSGKLSPWRSTRLVGGCGVIDFAGSGVVHMTGGIAALVAAKMIGPRLRWKSGLPQQSVVYQTLGVLMLWVGWYGFNGVSTLAITGYGGLAAHVMMTTTISAATGCLATTLAPGWPQKGGLHRHVSTWEASKEPDHHESQTNEPPETPGLGKNEERREMT